MSCNDNTQPLENKNYRLEFQPTKKTETSENSFVNEMGEVSVPVADRWKFCYENCQAVEQDLEKIQLQRTRDSLIKTLKSLENSMWHGSHAARLTRWYLWGEGNRAGDAPKSIWPRGRHRGCQPQGAWVCRGKRSFSTFQGTFLTWKEPLALQNTSTQSATPMLMAKAWGAAGGACEVARPYMSTVALIAGWSTLLSPRQRDIVKEKDWLQLSSQFPKPPCW